MSVIVIIAVIIILNKSHDRRGMAKTTQLIHEAAMHGLKTICIFAIKVFAPRLIL